MANDCTLPLVVVFFVERLPAAFLFRILRGDMVFHRVGRCFNLALVVVLLGTLIATIPVSAQEPDSFSIEPMQTVPVALDSALFAEPSDLSLTVAFLTVGTPVTVMDLPLTSDIDGQLWVRVATVQDLGYILVAALSAAPVVESDEALPTIMEWLIVTAPAGASCLSAPSTDEPAITVAPSGSSIGRIGDQAEGWIPVWCAESAGFIEAGAFQVIDDPAGHPDPIPTEIPAPVDPVQPSPDPVDPPSDPDPTSEPAPTTVAEQPEETTPPVSEPEIAAASLATGVGVVTGTGGAGVRCRSAESLSAPVLMVIAEGSEVGTRGAVNGSWQPVICAGQAGFIWADYIGSFGQPGSAPESSSSSAEMGIVQNTGGAGLRCRTAATLEAAIITVVPAGSSLPIRGSATGTWQSVTCAGQPGFVHTDFFAAQSAGTPVATPPAGSLETPQHSYSAGQGAKVAGTGGLGVRFRALASFAGPLIAVLPEGTGVNIIAGSTGIWVAVSFGGTSGYVHMDYLQPTGSAASVVPAPTPIADSVGSSDFVPGTNAIVSQSLRLRAAASLTSETLAVAPAQTVVKITGQRTADFYPVTWDTLSGFMHRDYLSFTTLPLSNRVPEPVGGSTPVGNAGNGQSTASGQAMVSFAMQYVGYPYVWATRGPSSFDCSGFTYWVTKNVLGQDITGGVILQWNYGAPVTYGNLQPGDLVFFQNTYTTGLSHVGLYIGNNQFVHAANEGVGVIVSNLTTDYYATRWFGARRLV